MNSPIRSLLAVGVMAVAATAPASELGIVVPAYFYPGGTGLGYWNDLADDASQVPITAIMNPGSGPGLSVDPNYTNVVDNLRAAGGTVIGYVSTSYTNRSLTDIQNDIDAYASWYNLDGIFLDEFTNTYNAADLTFYENLYGYIKNINPAWQVMGNPGTSTVEAYASRPTADVLVVHESFASGYDSYTPSSWNANYPSDRLAHLVHTQSDAASALDNIDQAFNQNAGLIYVTDDVLGNPWDRLPTYWDQHVAKVKAINDVIVDPDPMIKPGAIQILTNPVSNGTITVSSGNTDRSDWIGVTAYNPDPADDAGPEVDFLGIQIAHDDGSLYFRYDLDPASPEQPLGFRHNLFIDADQDRTTGFVGSGGFLPIGADYLLQGGTLYEVTDGANPESFDWTEITGIDFDDTLTNDIELRLARSLIGDPIAFDFVLNGANDSVGSIEDYYPNGGTAGVGGEYFTYATIPLESDLLGDYNGDGFVSQADLDLVLLNWGETVVPAEWLATDQFDGVQVSQNELDGVLLNWGNGTPPSANAIPEPASLTLIAGIGLFLRTRRATR